MTCLYGLVVQYSSRVIDLKDKLTLVKNATVEKANHDDNTIKSLREWVNLLHKEIEKLSEA